jgi:hypothetical protein
MAQSGTNPLKAEFFPQPPKPVSSSQCPLVTIRLSLPVHYSHRGYTPAAGEL